MNKKYEVEIILGHHANLSKLYKMNLCGKLCKLSLSELFLRQTEQRSNKYVKDDQNLLYVRIPLSINISEKKSEYQWTCGYV